MNLFTKSFFSLFFTIFLLSSKSAKAAATSLTSGKEDCQTICSDVSCSSWTGTGTSTPTSQVTFTAPTGVAVVNPVYTNSCTSATAGGVEACNAGCEATKINILDAKIAADTAAYKKKIGPNG